MGKCKDCCHILALRTRLLEVRQSNLVFLNSLRRILVSSTAPELKMQDIADWYDRFRREMCLVLPGDKEVERNCSTWNK